MALRFATNSLARFSSVVSVDWDHVTGHPDFDIPEHAVAIGDGVGGFNSAAPSAIGQALVSTGANSDPIFASLPWYDVALYASAQVAIDAAAAASGGTVRFSASTSLGSGAMGLDLDGIVVPIRLTGPDGPNGGTGQSVMISYSGTGVMVSAVANFGLEVEHLYFRATGAGVTMFDLDDGAYQHIHDCNIIAETSSASNIGITLANTQGACIHRNTIAIVGGTGIRGIEPAGSFAIQADISNNKFLASNDVCIEAPGQDWTIEKNIAQNPVSHFIKAGPATTCDVLNVFGNDIDDVTGIKTLITSNAGVLNSMGNRFAIAGGTVTCISQTNSTGIVNSIGDRLGGAVGIAIGTGNYLNIIARVTTAPWVPTALYTGTPANTEVVHTIGGAMDVTGRLQLGLSGAIAAALRLYNATSGHVELTTDTGALGTNTVIVPGFNDTLVVRSGAQTLQNKTINNTNIYTARDDRFTLQDSGDTTKQLVHQLSGLTTATTRTVTWPDADITVVGTSNSQTLSNKALVGTATNDSAAAGNIGEYIESVVTSAAPVALVTNTAKTVTSISLTAGDWDVSGIVYHLPAATTSYTRYIGSISNVDNTLNSNVGRFTEFKNAALVTGGTTLNDVIPDFRFSLSSTTTIYLIALGTFTVDTSAAYGIIRARRVR